MNQTDFTLIKFDKASHSYTYQGRRLQGVTSVVYKLKPPFDPEGKVAAKKAAERSTPEAPWTVEMIKAEWKKNRDASMERGSRVHEAIAGFFRGGFNQVDDPYLAYNADSPEMRVFKRLWATMAEEGNLCHVYEWVIGDAELGLAGTCDAVILNTKTITYHLFDWKTGGKFDRVNQFGGRLLAPFDDLDDCEFSVYSLQLSAYRLMIERNTGRELGDSYIVHLREDGHQFHKALDLRTRVEEWLRTK